MAYPQQEEGEIFCIDKALRWTSFDVVRKLKGITRYKKVGHAGTLDPLATGLLVICTGKKTKLIASIQDAEKEYTGIITLGATTESYDLEQALVPSGDYSKLSREEVLRCFETFTGEIEQVPPTHSAIKVEGQRAYTLARKGEDPGLKARHIHIYEFELTAFELPHLSFRVRCSKGTYIRSLAHDVGRQLGCGAHLSALRRTRIGTYSLEMAQSLEVLSLQASADPKGSM